MISRLRMRLDVGLQSILLLVLLSIFAIELWKINSITLLLVLTGFQLLSAAQLWWSYSYKPARVYLIVFLLVLVALPIVLPLLNPLAWSFLALLVLVYFVHTLRIASIVWRRPRSFWDIS